MKLINHGGKLKCVMLLSFFVIMSIVGLYRIVTFSSDEEAATAVQLFNGTLRPGSSLPLVVRFDRKSNVVDADESHSTG